MLLFAVADTGPLREGDRCCTCEYRKYDRSADFSDLFSEISTCDLPVADVREVKIFLNSFIDPIDSSGGQYIEPSIYETATSTNGVLVALFKHRYISPTNPHMLRCIIERFGCRKCKRILQQYTKKYLPCTCNS